MGEELRQPDGIVEADIQGVSKPPDERPPHLVAQPGRSAIVPDVLQEGGALIAQGIDVPDGILLRRPPQALGDQLTQTAGAVAPRLPLRGRRTQLLGAYVRLRPIEPTRLRGLILLVERRPRVGVVAGADGVHEPLQAIPTPDAALPPDQARQTAPRHPQQAHQRQGSHEPEERPQPGQHRASPGVLPGRRGGRGILRRGRGRAELRGGRDHVREGEDAHHHRGGAHVERLIAEGGSTRHGVGPGRRHRAVAAHVPTVAHV